MGEGGRGRLEGEREVGEEGSAAGRPSPVPLGYRRRDARRVRRLGYRRERVVTWRTQCGERRGEGGKFWRGGEGREGGKNKTKEKEKKWSKILKTVPSNRRKIEKCNVQHRIYTAAWTASRVEDQS